MCNLYSMTKTTEAVRRLFRVGHNRAATVERLLHPVLIAATVASLIDAPEAMPSRSSSTVRNQSLKGTSGGYQV